MEPRRLTTAKKIHGNNNAVQYEEGKYPYADEKGFLHIDNLTLSERRVMKTVSQWQTFRERHLQVRHDDRARHRVPHF